MKTLPMNLLIAIIIYSSSYIYTQTFSEVSPYPTQPTFYAVSALNDSTAFAVGDYSTMLKTTDGGESWFKISITSGYPINDLVFGSNLRAIGAGNSSYIYKTSNGGLTWSWNTLFVGGLRISSVCSINDSTYFITGSTGRVFKTTNFGLSWLFIGIPADNFMEDVFFISDSLGFVSTDYGEIYRTTNSGNTWQFKPTGTLSKLRDITAGSPGTLFAVGDKGTVAKSTNYGETWSSFKIADTDTLMKIHFAANGIGYITGLSGKIYISADGGNTWQTILPPVSFNGIGVNSSTSGKVFFAGRYGAVLQYSPGGSWNSYSYLQPDNFHSVSLADHDQAFAVADSGKVYKSPAYNTWNKLATPTQEDLYTIHAKGDTAVWAAGAKGTVIRKFPGTNDWQNINTPVTASLRSIFTKDQFSAIASGDSGTIILTTNAGVNWNLIPANTNNRLNSISFSDSGVGLIAGANGTILRSINGGLNWSQIGSPVTVNLNCVSTKFYPKVAIGADSGKVLWSMDGGISWSVSSLSNSLNITSMDFYNSSSIYLGLSDGKLYRMNFGDSFLTTVFSQNSNYYFTGISIWSINSIAVCGTNGKMLRYYHTPQIPVELLSFSAKNTDGKILLSWNTATETNNRGFEVQKSINNKEWFDIGFVTGSGTATEPAVYTFTDNYPSRGIMYYRLRQIDYDGRAEILRQIEVPFESSYELEQNYPNPFNPATEISYSIPYAGKVSIIVYDALGREVQVLVNKLQEPGRYTVSFDGSSLASGIYYYTISAGGFFETKKMILIK